MSILNRDAILGIDDRKTVSVDVPEWGGSVLIRPMSAGARDEWDAAVIKRKEAGEVGISGARALLTALCVVDEQGKPLFSKEDAELLAEKNHEAVGRIAIKAMEINGLMPNAVEDAAKN